MESESSSCTSCAVFPSFRVLTQKQCAQELIRHTKQQEGLIAEMKIIQHDIVRLTQLKFKSGLSKRQKQDFEQKQEEFHQAFKRLEDIQKQITKLRCCQPMPERRHDVPIPSK